MIRSIFISIVILIFFLTTFSTHLFAQTSVPTDVSIDPTASETAVIATESAAATNVTTVPDLTQPEELARKKGVLELFAKRPVTDVTILNATEFFVQRAVYNGVPANTIILILLLPFLATFFVFIRNVIGLKTLEMWVPIALSITLIATGVAAGAILLATILLASTIARMILKRLRIMQLPKSALSLLIVSLIVFTTLTISSTFGILTVKQLSIFPVLLLILLSDRIFALQIARGFKQTIGITSVTLILGILGFIFLSTDVVRNYILLYPESTLLLVPIDIIIGRYFGLRLTEHFRFATLRKYANQH